MVFDEALFSITFDRILPVVAFRSRMRSILMRVAYKNPVVAWTAALSRLFIASKNLPLKNIDRENLFPQAYRVDCFNQFNRGCVVSDSTRCSFGRQILRRASSNAVSWAFSPDLCSRIDYSWGIIPRAKKMVLIHRSHSPFREVS
jgi:hypothetical protein